MIPKHPMRRRRLATLCCAVVLGLANTAQGQVKIMFMVKGHAGENSQVAENALAQAFLRQRYHVIDPAVVAQTLRRNAALLRQSEVEVAKRLGAGLGADVVVSGEGKSRVVDKTYTLLEGKKVLVSQANLSVRAVMAHTGKVIVTEHASARKPFDTTGELALQTAAEVLAGRLLQGIERYLQRDTLEYRVVVFNVDHAQALAFQEGLRNRVTGVRHVDERGFAQNALELDVGVGKDEDFVFKQSLFSQLGQLGVGPLEVLAREGEAIYLRRARTTPTPQEIPPKAESYPSITSASGAPKANVPPPREPPQVTSQREGPATPVADGPTRYRAGYRKSWAVIIGINEYQAWPKLQYAVNDARAVENAARRLGFDEVITILDGEATQHRILRVLGDELYAKTEDDDRVFIFFAGHGQTQDLPNGDKVGYVIPVDGDLLNYYSSAISMRQLQDLAERIRAKHIFYAMDACFSGLLLRLRGDSLHDPPIELTTAPARQVLTAGSEGEKVAEAGGHGLFTKALLAGLAGGADLNNDGHITANELYQYITPQVLAESRNAQNPVFGRLGQGHGEFVFVRK